MSVMNNNQFIEKLKHIASLPTTYYSVAGGNWAKWNGKSWNFDCVILVKSILWGWNENKNHEHGGAKYGSNGVYDDGTEQIIKRCSNVSSDFTKIEKGELLWMPGHVGVYIGNRQVIECTGAWERKVLYSNIGSNGARSRNGNYVGRWQKHGKLPYLKYEVEETPSTSNKYKLGDKVNINGVYVSSDSTNKLNPAYTTGTITRIIEGARNPYLIDSGNLGWTNDNCIVSATTTPNKKTLDEVAKDVIAGKYGNYPERKEKLEAEGYNYSIVQTRVNEILAPKVNYLSNTTYTGVSIVDGLKGIGVDSSYQYRTRLAEVNNISDYRGSAEQNTRMLELLKNGRLKSV